MKKIICLLLIIIYIFIAAVITYSLMSFNKYNFAEINNKVIYANDEDNHMYRKNDLLLIDKNEDYKVGDMVFYYSVNSRKMNIEFERIKEINILDENNYTYIFESGNKTTKENMIGKDSGVVSYRFIGYLYSVLTSKSGYLFTIVLPILIAFLYEIYRIVMEVLKK